MQENAQEVKTICQQVEGMPLGLELAATWLRAMSCREIAAQMAGSMDFLMTPLRNVPERHRSLRAVFNQSWQLLSETERSVWMKLSIFHSGFDRESAEYVAGAPLYLLADLVDKSLIRLNAAGRYDLHEMLRQYGAEKLADAGLTAATSDRHLKYFLNLARQAESHEFGREQIRWFDHLEIELDNLRAALAWSLQAEKPLIGLELVASLGWFLSERFHVFEGLEWLERLLKANPDAPVSLRSKALHSAASMAGLMSDTNRAHCYAQQALDLARQANDQWNIGWSLSHLGFYGTPDWTESVKLLEESLLYFRQLEDEFGLSHSLLRRGWRAVYQHDYAYARKLLEECAVISEDTGDRIALAWVYHLLGLAVWLQSKDIAQARAYYQRSLALFREARFIGAVSETLCLLAVIELAAGNDLQAESFYKEAFSLIRHNVERRGIFILLDLIFIGMAGVARSLGQWERAATILGAVSKILALYSGTGYEEVFSVMSEAAAVRTQLGETAFAEAWRAGEAMTTDQLFDYTFEMAVHPDDQSTFQPLVEPLSARELEVLRLIAEGLSNAEIAAKLYLSVGTIKVHTRSIYGKLGVNSRTQAVTQAQKLNLL